MTPGRQYFADNAHTTHNAVILKRPSHAAPRFCCVRE